MLGRQRDSMSEPPPTVSFVVIAHNEAAGIGDALRSIAAQPVDAETIVVDDGSTDGTSEAAVRSARAEPRLDLRVVRLPSNLGRGAARRAGVDAARGRFIATVDADIVLPADWWARCLDELTRTGADAVAGTAVPDGDLVYLRSMLGLTPRPRPHTTAVTGSNAVFRREALAASSFDPALREGEDVALGQSLRASGASLRTVPDLYVDHRDRRQLGQAMRWGYDSGRGATRQLVRYGELRRPDLATAGWLLTVALGAAQARSQPRRASASIAIFTLLCAAGHVTPAFAWRCARGRWLAAVGLDAFVLTSYFAGRVTGLPAALRPVDRSP